MSWIIWVIIAIVVIVVLWPITVFNSLIRLRNRVKEAWSDIEVQLKRRYDLIPNLVETVKGYMMHEKDVFEKVTQARSQAISAKGFDQKAKAEDALSGTLKTLFAVSEAYPELKANTNFLELQRELADTENKIQAARRFYNTNVMEINNKIETFPSNIIAGIFKFQKQEFFAATEAEKAPVQVKF
jgi:LemA protein